MQPAIRATTSARRLAIVALFLSTVASAAPGQCPLAKLQEAASNDLDEFGWNLALDGDVLAVGELGLDEGGSVHLFDVSDMAAHGRWTELDEVFAGDPAPLLRFGESLALSGGTLAAGTTHDTQQGSNAGAVYVFERDDGGTPGNPADDAWVQTAKLVAGGASPVSRFGKSVALVGDTLAVGATGNLGTAAVYVFQRDDQGTASKLDDTWAQAARIDPDGLSSSSDLGASVDLSADEGLLLAGDPQDATGGGSGGAGVVFVRVDSGVLGDPLDDTWVQAAKLQLGPGSDPFASIGQSVLLGDDVGLVGAPSAGEFDFGGRVYVFERDTLGTPDALDDVWTFTQELAGQSGTYGGFGTSMALDGDVLAVPQPSWQFPPSWGTNVRVFERSGGVFTFAHTLEAPDRQVADGVGGGVAVAGSLVFSGASGAEYIDDWAPADGAAYVWDLDRPTTWHSDGASLGQNEPIFAGWGSLEAGSTFAVRSYDLFDSPQIWFLVGLTRIDQPFKGGVIVPSPDLIVGPVSSDAFGSVTLGGTWPAGIPGGTELWFQSWAVDGPPTPSNLRDSQGMRAVAN